MRGTMKKINAHFEVLLKYKHLLMELVVRDIKVRYRKSVLGILWTLLNPLMMMMIMTVIFSYLFQNKIPNYQVYFLSGYIAFIFFSDATNQSIFSIISNASLIKKVYIPKYLFPISKVLSSLVNYGFSFIALIIVMLLYKAPFKETMLLSFIPIIYLTIFTTGVSLLLAAVNVFFRDIAHLYSIFIVAWTYCTPIFYPESIIPEKYSWIITYNPMYYFVKYFRSLILTGQFPDANLNIICGTTAIGTFIIGIYVFYKAHNKFILYL